MSRVKPDPSLAVYELEQADWGDTLADHRWELEALLALARGDEVAETYVVRVEWDDKPEPLFRLRCYGVSTVRQWSDLGSWTADALRVKAREMVCEALRVEYVDCPENVTVYYDQAAVERLTQGAS